MTTKKIAVVGAGPAGIMAAIRAAEFKQKVILIEKNPSLGRKLLLSGKGRCNLTNACGLEDFLKHFSHQGQFLRDAFKYFFNRELIAFFEKRGLRLKTERQWRVFPVTDRSESIVEVLKKELIRKNVQVHYRSRVQDVLVEEGRVKGVWLGGQRLVDADRVILACGGMSYPACGSNGDGIKMAQNLGHRITELQPGLVPLETKEKYPRLLEGLTLKNIRLKFRTEAQRIISEIGELLFTDFGVSGPLVLSLSGRIVDWLKEKKRVYLEIDLKPALSSQQLKDRLFREFQAEAKKTVKGVLENFLPKRLVTVFLEVAKISPQKIVSQITQQERRQIIFLLKGFPLEIAQSRPLAEAMVTRGGVSLKEINPRTMESRRIKGLYFAGEMIDVDADTGGFNLQAAFSTGYLAGESAALN